MSMPCARSRSTLWDYVLKLVEPARLRQTLDRARIGFRAGGLPGAGVRAEMLPRPFSTNHPGAARPFAERIPVRKRDEIVFVPVRKVASVVAEGELLHWTTDNETHTITYRLQHLKHA